MKASTSWMGLLALAALVGCATSEKSLQEQGMKPMSASELKQIFVQSRTFDWTSAQNVRGVSHFMTDGSARVEWPGSGDLVGRHWVDKEMVCTRYAEIDQGAQRCGRWYRTGDNTFKVFRENGQFVFDIGLRAK